jgi:DNA processing protein
MSSRRRCLAALSLACLLATLALLAQPSPPPARANIACDAIGGAANTVTGGVNAITGGLLGTGNPASDACNSVTDGAVNAVTSPVTDALKGIGNGVFDQITTWVSEGATWLIGQVVAEIERTTTPKLTSEGFLAEYGQMAEIAAVLAAAMALLAVLEALAQGSWGVLAKVVLVNLPVAFIATSVAFAVVQLLLVATDGMCHAIAVATQEHSKHFFRSAITSLGKAGGTAGGVIDNPGGIDPASGAAGHAAGSVEVPLFVTFLAAIIGGFAAFFVWIELIARDAAVYVVALFMPMALAASIWPRWSGALRRTGELVVVVIASKFVIVSIIALAAGLIAEGQSDVEHVLAASALMLLACFAPFMLLRLVPFAEGAMAAAYGRRSASGAALGGLQLASEVQIIRNMARSNWGASPPEVWNLGSNGGGSGGGNGGGSPRGGGGRGGGGEAGAARAGTSAAGGEAAAGAGASAGAAAASPAAAAASVPVAAAKSARSGAQRLEQTATAQAATGSGTSQGTSQGGQAPGASPPGGEPSGESAKPAAASPSEQPPRPPQELPAKGGAKGSK